MEIKFYIKSVATGEIVKAKREYEKGNIEDSMKHFYKSRIIMGNEIPITKSGRIIKYLKWVERKKNEKRL